MSTRLTPYGHQREQKWSCLVSFITVWCSLPHSSVQVVEWQSGRTDYVCVKMQQLSLSYFFSFSLPPSFPPSPLPSVQPSLFKQAAVALNILDLIGWRLPDNKIPSHLYPKMSHERIHPIIYLQNLQEIYLHRHKDGYGVVHFKLGHQGFNHRVQLYINNQGFI